MVLVAWKERAPLFSTDRASRCRWCRSLRQAFLSADIARIRVRQAGCSAHPASNRTSDFNHRLALAAGKRPDMMSPGAAACDGSPGIPARALRTARCSHCVHRTMAAGLATRFMQQPSRTSVAACVAIGAATAGDIVADIDAARCIEPVDKDAGAFRERPSRAVSMRSQVRSPTHRSRRPRTPRRAIGLCRLADGANFLAHFRAIRLVRRRKTAGAEAWADSPGTPSQPRARGPATDTGVLRVIGAASRALHEKTLICAFLYERRLQGVCSRARKGRFATLRSRETSGPAAARVAKKTARGC